MLTIRKHYFFPPRSWRRQSLLCNGAARQIILRDFGPRTEQDAKEPKAAMKKQTTGLTEDGLPVHSFHSLLADLATLARATPSPPRSRRTIRSPC